jgi:uncharacterized protein with GYD domain
LAKYIVLFNWTDQGVKAAKDSVNRVQQTRGAFAATDTTIEAIYWCLGQYDLVAVVQAKDDQSVTAALLNLAAAGNVRTSTLRAFDQSEFEQIIRKMG